MHGWGNVRNHSYVIGFGFRFFSALSRRCGFKKTTESEEEKLENRSKEFHRNDAPKGTYGFGDARIGLSLKWNGRFNSDYSIWAILKVNCVIYCDNTREFMSILMLLSELTQLINF